MSTTHLAAVLAAAAAGRFPAPDGNHVVPSPGGPVDAVVGFPFHHVIATSLDADEVLAHLDADDPGAPLHADFLAWMAARLGTSPGSLDVVLACRDATALTAAALPSIDVSRRSDAVDHPRVHRAARYRSDLVIATDDGLGLVATAGRGLAGRWEIAFELAERLRGRGHGPALATYAASLAPPGEPIFAQVAPANVSSLRTLLAAGFTPIGAEVLFPVRSPSTQPASG